MKKILLFGVLCFAIEFAYAGSPLYWSAPMDVAAGSFSNMYPRITLIRSGNPIVIWSRMSDQSLQLTRWMGSYFSTPISINPGGIRFSSASWMGPDIASHGDTIYVVARQAPESADTSKHIWLLSSYNAGLTFETPVRVDYIANHLARFPTVTTDANGHPIVAFMKFDLSFGNARWVVARSNDYGRSFSGDVLASGWSGAGSEVCDCCPGVLASLADKTIMLYRNNDANIRDVWAGLSTDNAMSFTSGFNADNHNWMLMSCPSSGPDAIIKGDTLYSVFMNGDGGTDFSYFSKSSLTSGGMNSITPLGTGVVGILEQNYPRIASDGNAMAIIWQQNVGGRSHLPIWFTDSISNGFPDKIDTIALQNVGHSDIAMKNGDVYVVWQDISTGTVKFRHGGFYIPTSVSPVSSSLPLIHLFPNPATHLLTIDLPEATNSRLVITDLTGCIMTSMQIQNQKLVEVDVSAWPSAIYVVEILSNESITKNRFVKN